MSERRVEQRAHKPSVQYPVSCVLRYNGHEFVAEVVNYHYRGACLSLEHIPDYILDDVASGVFKVDFHLGRLCLHSELPYRVCWADLRQSKTMGVEFLSQPPRLVDRAERFLVNANFAPQISAADPLDANRLLVLKAVDVSETGMLLQTSLTNKHLFPGMRLSEAELSVPGMGAVRINLNIENARPAGTPGMFLLGMSIQGQTNEYRTMIRQYLSTLVMMDGELDEHMDRLSRSGFLAKQIKAGITYRIVSTQQEYEDVLKLRFKGYGRHHKLKADANWRDQGDGLDKEGAIVAGYLAGQLVCSMEVRFGDGSLPLRAQTLLGTREIPGLDISKVVEFNKLVIHPRVQGTDAVVGMMQRTHAIVVNHGQADIILFATDKLKDLYQRVGAQEVGVRVAHPYLVGEYLNLLCVPRSVYHDGLRCNPYAWNTIYRVLHEQFKAYGVTSERHETIMQRISARVQARLHALQKRRRGQTPGAATTVKSFGTNVSVIDPKWTHQDFLATVMYPYLLEAIDMMGQEKVDQILAEIGIPLAYFTKQSNWLSVKFHDEFLRRCGEYIDKRELSRRAGYRAMQRDLIGMNYYVFKHFLTPYFALQSFAKIMPRFNKTRTYEVADLRQGSARVSLGLRDKRYLPDEHSSCDNWGASFEAYLLLMTGRAGKVKKLSCCYDGDRTCSYELVWQNTKYKIPQITANTLAMIATAGAGYWGQAHGGGAFAMAVSALVATTWFALTALLSIRRLRKEAAASHKEFTAYQQEAADRYSELQAAKGLVDEMYREAKLLEATSKEIQGNSALSKILQSTLDSACKSFSFDRAFAMLIDDDRTRLETAAVSGIEGDTSDLWQFHVNVATQRDNPVVLSSVFHSGNPIVINDIEAHLFQLNESSRALVRRFASQGFVIVGIPAREGRWGVIVADKKSKERVLDRRDVVILERLAQQLGMALDKRSDFEREQKLRSYFQKYVPSRVLAAEKSLKMPQLGGQIKDICVMFVDIRDFTRLSESFPPNVTLEILNRFCGVLEPIVSSHDGVIDKYLGDGALITWGTADKDRPDFQKCIRAALDIMRGIENLNIELQTMGYPQLKIGIGINQGPATVGNIGSEKRMEYTCIGASVNLASRLEALCKVLDGLVVTADAITDPSCLEGENWELVEGVEVRGVTQPMRVWVHRGRLNEQSHLRSIA